MCIRSSGCVWYCKKRLLSAPALPKKDIPALTEGRSISAVAAAPLRRLYIFRWREEKVAEPGAGAFLSKWIVIWLVVGIIRYSIAIRTKYVR